ncbi:MAG: sterol desaturase family protein [Alphaproteobacteria bacterium]|nr:sterol desaturase family protein [Alphaproteobacteria bacterium]
MDFFRGVTGLYFALGVLASALVLEAMMPWRRGVKISPARWVRNASMSFYSFILLGLLPLLSAYGAAMIAEARGLGVFNQMTAPLWVTALAAIIAFDLTAYGVHRSLHKWYFLWRTHRTHHGDAHIDATTSLRFHPFEALVRAIIDLPVVFLLGLPEEAIVVNFVVLTVVNTFTHTNIALAPSVERVLSRILVTPHIHRLHHSAAPEHLDTNLGTIFSLWDRLFATFTPSDRLRENEVFGIEGPEAITPDSFANLALDPFRKPDHAAIPKPEPRDARP